MSIIGNDGTIINEEQFGELVKQDPHHYLAFIIDGKVEYVLGTDIKFTAILLSNPIIKNITDLPYRMRISEGATYNEQTDTITPLWGNIDTTHSQIDSNSVQNI